MYRVIYVCPLKPWTNLQRTPVDTTKLKKELSYFFIVSLLTSKVVQIEIHFLRFQHCIWFLIARLNTSCHSNRLGINLVKIGSMRNFLQDEHHSGNDPHLVLGFLCLIFGMSLERIWNEADLVG